jgi:8-oxo-dGTP pyrophosphatase MutT (NUDIX family)
VNADNPAAGSELGALPRRLLRVSHWVEADDPALRQAAVLVPLIGSEHGPQVLLTERSNALPHHAGQISFPGGQREPHDFDPQATALREAEEEIGLEPAAVAVLGSLESYVTGTGFVITPIIGVLEVRPELRVDRQEVDSVFEVPLAFFQDQDNLGQREGVWRGQRRRYFEYRYEHYRVWGATAQILVNLCKKLQN